MAHPLKLETSPPRAGFLTGLHPTGATRVAALLTTFFSLTLFVSGERAYELQLPAPEPTPEPLVAPPPVIRDWPIVASPTHSIQVFLWWQLDVAVRDVDLVRDLGFTWVKQRIAWRDVEPAGKGFYDWFRPDFIMELVEHKDVDLIVLLDHQPLWAQADQADLLSNSPPADYQDFGDFCRAFSERYRGQVAAYQVWNEPNLAREWGGQPPNPADYARLLKACYEGVKAGDPDAIVISAGLAPTGTDDTSRAMPDEQFLREMYAAGAQPYFDMLGLNAPGYFAPPWVSPDEVEAKLELGGNRWASFRHVEDMRAIMEEYDDTAKQIAILEMGWTTDPIHDEYRWFAVDEETQAEYLVAAYEWAQENWQPWIGIMNMIYLADPDWTEDREEYWWAITFPGWPEPELRPAYYALQAMEK